MTQKCDINGAEMADHMCDKCKKSVFYSCIDENGLDCEICPANDDNMEGVKSGFSTLNKSVTLLVLMIGIAVIIIGIAIVTWG